MKINGVLDRQRRLVGEYIEEGHVVVGEFLPLKGIYGLYDAEELSLVEEGGAEHRFRNEPGAPVKLGVKALVIVHVVDVYRFPYFRDPSGDSLPEFYPVPLRELLADLAQCDLEDQVVRFFLV